MKKILSLLLLSLILISGFPVFGTMALDHSHDGTAISTFSDLNNLFKNGGSGYLTQDILMDSSNKLNYSIEADTPVYLCLNGHMIDLNQSFIYIKNGATVNIYDCENNESNKHYFTETWKATNTETEYFVCGGVITNGYCTRNEFIDGCGGAIENLGSLTIENVTFAGNKAVNNGGAIYNTNTLNLYNCNFYGNTATDNGGAISNYGNALLKGCKVKYNNAVKGGAIVSSGRLTLIDTDISENISDKQGAVCITYASETVACLAKGTKITMADNSQKAIEDIAVGDIIKTFDHNTASLSTQTVCFVYESKDSSKYFTLNFSNGKKLDVVGVHDLFEKESNKYVRITKDNASEYIGNHFYNANENKWEELIDVTYKDELTKYYSIYSSHHMNCIAEDMLTVPDDVDFVLNAFEMDNDLKYYQIKKQEDILKYGLFEYNDNPYFTKEEFDNYNGEYFNVYIGKGLATTEEIMGIIKASLGYLGEDITDDFDLSDIFGISPLFADIQTIDCNSYFPEITNTTLILGDNVTIKNNLLNSGYESNIFLNKDEDINAYIRIIDGANNITAGVSIPTDTGLVASSTDSCKDFFTVDNISEGYKDSHYIYQINETDNTYSVYITNQYISEQPKASNSYTVSMNKDNDSCTYKWYENEDILLEDITGNCLTKYKPGNRYYCIVTNAYGLVMKTDVFEIPDNDDSPVIASPDKEIPIIYIGENRPEIKVLVSSDTYITENDTFSAKAPIIIENNRTFLGIRDMAYALGIAPEAIKWNDKTKTASITKSGATISVTQDCSDIKITYGGYIYTLKNDVSAINKNDRIYLPFRVIFQLFGYTVNWDNATRTITCK